MPRCSWDALLRVDADDVRLGSWRPRLQWKPAQPLQLARVYHVLRVPADTTHHPSRFVGSTPSTSKATDAPSVAASS